MVAYGGAAMMTKFFKLHPGQLTLQQLKQLNHTKQPCQLADESLAAIEAAHALVNTVVETGRTVYGINTGFGALAHCVIPPADLTQLQKNIVLSHACGTGDLLDDNVVSTILLLKINSLAQGCSGIRLMVIEALLALYNNQVYPCIPCKGSVGASGDLAPLAHLALPLLGYGEVRYHGKILSAEEGLAIAGLKAISLGPKEGLALLNGLQASAAVSIHAYWQAETLFQTAIVAGALSTDAVYGSDIPFDPRIHAIRGHAAQSRVALQLQQLLAGSAIRESHRNCQRVQDPYSVRCQPQIMGAVRHQLDFICDTLSVEVNAVTDNPLIFAEQGDILSGGNFHGEMIAMAADNMALAIAEMGAASERRIALLVDKEFSSLPAFLVKTSGIDSGFMLAHVTAAACASDNKALAHPHVVDSLPTSANQEDHVSMAMNAGRRLAPMLDNTATILAVELLAACQGLEFHKPQQTSHLLQPIYEKVRAFVPAYEHDRYFAPDINVIKGAVLQGIFAYTPFCDALNKATP